MADQRLQQLRRAWDEGDLEAQARLLCERMRAGELAEERMRLAALLGHSSSSQIIGRNTALTVEEIPAACAEFSAEAQVRIMLAAFAAAWPTTPLTPLNEEPRCLHSDYRQRIEAWTCCPCSDCASQLANVDEDFWILGWYVSSGEFLTAWELPARGLAQPTPLNVIAAQPSLQPVRPDLVGRRAGVRRH